MYPALAVAEALRQTSSASNGTPLTLHYIGSIGGMERDLIQRAGDLFASYDEVQAGPLHGVSAGRVVISTAKLAVGILQTLRLIARYRPQALFLTGGWVTFPVALACRARNIPIAIFLPDIEPGLAIKVLSRLARVIYATTADSAAYFPAGKVIETGYPLRADVLTAKRADAFGHFQLDASRHTLLVFGGSRGARSINEAFGAIVSDVLDDGLQVIHISGELDWSAVQARRTALPADQQARYHVYPYLHGDMGLALAAADLVVSRAGASTLGEFPQFGLPAILVPYPFAWRYQKVNADWLAARGAAIRLNDEAMRTELLPTIRALFADSARLAVMREKAAALAHPEGAAMLAQRLIAIDRTTI